MATVYRGRHRETGQVVAVKLMAAEAASNPVLVRRFENELTVATRLHHPNIIQAYDFGLHQGRPYLAMEFVNGQNLGQRIRRGGALPEAEAVRVIIQIADALHCAHQNKLIHRDVKSDNILLKDDGQAMLADLGLIKDLDKRVGLTRTRTCQGVIAFIAPEQYEEGKRADVRSDLYGLGATLYHAVTGAVPFHGRRHLQILHKKLRNDFTPPGRIVPTLDPRVEATIRRALDASPEKRPASCREFIDCLLGVLPQSPVAAADRQEDADRAEGSESHSGEERRRAVRYPTTLDASCRPIHDALARWRAEVQDISATGVRLGLDRRFEPGALLAVEILDEESRAASRLLVKVLWVRQEALRRWVVGCAFGQELCPSDLETLLGNKAMTVLIHQGCS